MSLAYRQKWEREGEATGKESHGSDSWLSAAALPSLLVLKTERVLLRVAPNVVGTINRRKFRASLLCCRLGSVLCALAGSKHVEKGRRQVVEE